MTSPPARAHINPLLLTRDLLGQTDPADDLPVDVRQALGACLGNLYLATGRIRTNPCGRVSLLRSLLSQLVDFGVRLQSSRNECEELVEAACSLLVHLPKSNFADARELHSTLEEALSALMSMRPGDVHLDAPSELERTYLLSKKSKNAYVDAIGDANDIDFLPRAVFVRSEGLGDMGIKGWAGYRHVVMCTTTSGYTLRRVGVPPMSTSQPPTTPNSGYDMSIKSRDAIVLSVDDVLTFSSKILEDWARDQESWSDDVLAIFDYYPEYRSTYFCVCGARPARIFM
ncbi:unnamed protein product (mitochondrion) [Plasmodiophora brassicae]|uniref:Uncharacterized protein n=1 Tax=Plasmodiophora brassicae TaxID=37360 RepID=A0A3P3YP98_PLABS|nr:unnamed protein product [Plasmodiophora brassicae]